MLPQIIIAANAFALDEGLGCGFDIMLVFERVCLGAARQPIILDVEPFALEQVQGLETKGTDMSVCHHAIDHSLSFRGWNARVGNIYIAHHGHS